MAPRTTSSKRSDAAGDDRFDMLKSGKCELVVNGVTHRFRRPKFGEFRTIRESMFERDDTALRLTAELNDARAAAAPPAPIPREGSVAEPPQDTRTQTEKLDEVMTNAKARRVLDAQITDLNIAWVTESLTMVREDLSVDLPEVDEWPPEMVEAQFMIDLVNHWRHRPLAHGGAPTPQQ